MYKKQKHQKRKLNSLNNTLSKVNGSIINLGQNGNDALENIKLKEKIEELKKYS